MKLDAPFRSLSVWIYAQFGCIMTPSRRGATEWEILKVIFRNHLDGAVKRVGKCGKFGSEHPNHLDEAVKRVGEEGSLEVKFRNCLDDSLKRVGKVESIELNSKNHLDGAVKRVGK